VTVGVNMYVESRPVSVLERCVAIRWRHPQAANAMDIPLFRLEEFEEPLASYQILTYTQIPRKIIVSMMTASFHQKSSFMIHHLP
jgi:hypothetical protein